MPEQDPSFNYTNKRIHYDFGYSITHSRPKKHKVGSYKWL